MPSASARRAWAVITALAAALYAQVRPAPVPRWETETVARHLETPWSLAFAPDGRLFVAERPGRIRIVSGGALMAEHMPEPWATVPAYESAEIGLEEGLMGPSIPNLHRTNECTSATRTAGKAPPQTGSPF